MEKQCNTCKRHLPFANFNANKNKRDGYQLLCRECQRAYRIKHYTANKEQYFHRNRKTIARIREQVLMAKESAQCADCGISYPGEPWLMEFDHLRDKRYVLNRVPTLRLLQEELSKGEFVCLVCHRRRTAKTFSWRLNRLGELLSGSMDERVTPSF